jgi:hypothetical protein
MMSISKRQWALGAGLAATLAAVAWVGSGDPASDTVAAANGRDGKPARTSTAARRHSEDQAPAGGVEPARLIRVVESRKVGDPFGSTSFLPPPPPPQKSITVAAPPPAPPAPPVAPPAPRAPAFPWTFMGRMIEDPQNPAVFLSRSDRLTVARIGDTLDNVWKVNGMDAKGLRVEYLPLKSNLTVNMSNGSDLTGGNAAALGAQQPTQLAPQLQQLGVSEPQQAPPQPAQSAVQAPPPAVSGIEISSGIGSPQPN